jgi:hypothetical protein
LCNALRCTTGVSTVRRTLLSDDLLTPDKRQLKSSASAKRLFSKNKQIICVVALKFFGVVAQ